MESKVFMLSTGKTIKVPVYMENIDGLLYNSNTHRYEALEGDWGVYGKSKEGEIEGYTDFQCVKFKGLPGIVMLVELAINGAIKITYKTTISHEIEDQRRLNLTFSHVCKCKFESQEEAVLDLILLNILKSGK